jgi:calcineurin-like phosphoesterase family protein
MTTFFTSDEHYYHHNILHYEDRPWSSAAKMNEALIGKHNSVVGKNDIVYHVGDFSLCPMELWRKLGKVLSRLNGHHHLILGNHDNLKPFKYVEIGFISVHTSMALDIGSKRLIMSHDPSGYTIIQKIANAYMLCGHVHSLFKSLLPEKKVINVGVDVWDYTPVSEKQILEML